MRLRTLTPFLAAAFTLAACSQQDPTQKVSSALADSLLLPSYSHWAEQDQALSQSAKAFCQGNLSLEHAQQSYLAAQHSWAALQPILIGPLAEGNRAWQVQFWPDKKDLVARQVEGLLKHNSALKSTDLAKASVAVKGLSAYEYILFDQRIDLTVPEQKEHYCALLVAIGDYQANLAREVLSEWQAKEGMHSRLSQFPNAYYADANEAIAELVRTQVNALDGLKKKLGAPLGKQTKGVPQPFQADAWRSQSSLSNLQHALVSAQKLWTGEQNQGLRALLAEDSPATNTLDQAFTQTLDLLNGQSQSLTQLLQTAEGKQWLNELYDSLNRLHRAHETDLAKALGISLGFNAHDGD